jgi:hypothetical protein
LLRPTCETLEAAAASAVAVQIRVFNASTIAEIDTAFAALASERPDALLISSGPFFLNRVVQIAHLATRHARPREIALVTEDSRTLPQHPH